MNNKEKNNNLKIAETLGAVHTHTHTHTHTQVFLSAKRKIKTCRVNKVINNAKVVATGKVARIVYYCKRGILQILKKEGLRFYLHAP